MGLGALTFLNPWLLLGLAAIPLIWWLLRFTPPTPQRITFPATRLLAGLQSRERTPARSPWWLTVLRILLVTLAVLALSGPVLNPPGAQTSGGAPLLLVVDNGWSAASRWDAREAAIGEALDAPQRNGQTVVLAPSAGITANWSATPATPADVRERAASLSPKPYAPDRGGPSGSANSCPMAGSRSLAKRWTRASGHRRVGRCTAHSRRTAQA